MLAGVLIDLSGFRLAFAVLALLPLASLAWARRVPREARPTRLRRRRSASNAWNLLQRAGLHRALLLVNWLLSSSWDVHSFLVPILGHERGFSASAIGLVLGVFAVAVAAVRLAIPFLAHRLAERKVLVVAMLTAGAVFAVYPFAHAAWVMGACAVVLGFALGAVQPMVMTTLHQITPAAPARRGDRPALDGDQLSSARDAARLRPRRRRARRVGAVLGDGRGGRLGQRRGAPDRAAAGAP